MRCRKPPVFDWGGIGWFAGYSWKHGISIFIAITEAVKYSYNENY
jgi:hypothetical protein